MMKKTKILTLIVFSLLFLDLSAQDYRSFRFGLRFDPNISWLKANTPSYKRSGSKIGYAFGLSTEFFLSENYLFSTGVIISSVGGDLAYQGVYEDINHINIASRVEQSYNIKYVEIPLILKLRTDEVGYMTYYGQFGLKVSSKYRSTSNFTYTDIKGSPKIEGVNTAGDLFFVNTYLVIGAGIEYNITGNTNLMLGISYNNGFINQLDKKYHELDKQGNAELDPATNQPVFSSKDASANLNYFALNIGIYF